MEIAAAGMATLHWPCPHRTAYIICAGFSARIDGYFDRGWPMDISCQILLSFGAQLRPMPRFCQAFRFLAAADFWAAAARLPTPRLAAATESQSEPLLILLVVTARRPLTVRRG